MITTTTTTTTTTVLLQTKIISKHDYHTTAWKLTCTGNLLKKKKNSRLWKKAKISRVYGYIKSQQRLN
jgi:beta-galactosidase/beta-glucuronidase